MLSAEDGNEQYRQKQAPMQWQVAFILSILLIPCVSERGFAII